MSRATRRPGPATAVLLLLVAALLGAVPTAARAAVPTAPAAVAAPAARSASVPAATAARPAGVTVTGIDLHDGQIQKFGSTYYLYGTMYKCGYTWWQPNTPWCGFGVSTAPSMSGPWSAPQLLFSPTAADPYNPGNSYQSVCGGVSGYTSGCFSPRMVQRSGWGANDGVFVLWFNAPAYMDLPAPNKASHAYMTMGCNGPAGPCGASAGAPYGTTYRPVLHQCDGANGDAGLTADSENGSIALVCTKQENSLSIEQLDKWGTNGTGNGANYLAGVTAIEATGTYRDAATGTWVMTYADKNCGYCTGTGAGYATAPSMLGPWTAPANLGVGQPANGRRAFSANSCGGQVDTVTEIDGQAWQKIDLWTGSNAEPNAGLRFEPLVYTPTTNTAGDGTVWRTALAPFTCTDAPDPVTPPAPVTVSGVDLHDGQIQKFGSTYYLYGTMYGCGYTWLQNPTTWCGFGVSTAPSMSGPWSAPQPLFSPTAADPYNPGNSYQGVCAHTGSGCFSPRMVQRSGWGANDGVFVLWFNAPGYKNLPAPNTATHGYMTMGCNGPAGPCGASAGAPYGTTHRPNLHQCDGANGDAGLTTSPENNAIALVCPQAGTASIALEQLTYWGTDGTGTGVTGLAGLSSVESTGTYRDPATGTWVMTYADKNCGFCSGTGTGYATAPSMLGPWTAPANLGVGQPANGRRLITATSCGGKPDTVSVIDGQAWQKINLWTGSTAPAGSNLHFEPLDYVPGTGTPGDGKLWRPPFVPFSCT
ncbi:hypothetical protein ACFW1A_30965 [Kitasatospora sp. NPDC058965]|uniref:hypothetical protein n=1 Tax=Kitasatospora sp. NPDC058965 TaxID=3346682 RepID=UPI00369A204F